ncbi:MAG: hypothetical protein KatS3mg114_0898 [Planctomycetaceae bacterium]|nr:MAG: hypothetical protein KatS3mg114_0898 [Planctomycetaceae bacterium]
MRIGLTFEEYVDLRLKPLAGADPVFIEAAEMEREALFPMTTAQAASHLRSRGYDCKPQMLELLVENGVVRPAQADAWQQVDVETVADYFEDAEIFTPYAAACQTFGFRYADFLRALREAAEQASRKYGRHVRDDDQLFVMHRVPPRGVTDEKGNLVEIKPAVISFTLADDIRERLERGEEV